MLKFVENDEEKDYLVAHRHTHKKIFHFGNSMQ